MDRVGADFYHSVDTIVDRLKCRPVPIQIPVGAEDQFKGIVDLVEMKAVIWRDETLGAEYDVVEIPEDLLEKAQEYREQMIEAISEFDDALFEKFVEGEAADRTTRSSAGIRKATIALKIFPVICGSAFKNKGVQTMLDAVVDYLPSPLDVPPIEGMDVDDPDEDPDPARPPTASRSAALVFKIMTDPYVGPAGVLPGVLGQDEAPASRVFNVAKGRKERVGRLLRMHANKREDIQEILAGDICAAVGLEDGFDRRYDLRRRSPDRARIDRLPDAGDSARGGAEDQGRSGKDGHGDSEAGAGRSYVPGQYRSGNRADHSLRHGRTAPGNHRGPHDARVRRGRECRQAAGGVSRNHSQERGSRRPPCQADRWSAVSTAHVKIRVEPLPSGTGFEFDNDITGGKIPKEFINPIEAGIKEALEGGILAGFPMSDVKVTLYDGSYHDVDSSEMAFKIAGSMASRKRPGAPSRCCWSRSWRWKWWCRKSTWATSSAT